MERAFGHQPSPSPCALSYKSWSEWYVKNNSCCKVYHTSQTGKAKYLYWVTSAFLRQDKKEQESFWKKKFIALLLSLVDTTKVRPGWVFIGICGKKWCFNIFLCLHAAAFSTWKKCASQSVNSMEDLTYIHELYKKLLYSATIAKARWPVNDLKRLDKRIFLLTVFCLFIPIVLWDFRAHVVTFLNCYLILQVF